MFHAINLGAVRGFSSQPYGGLPEGKGARERDVHFGMVRGWLVPEEWDGSSNSWQISRRMMIALDISLNPLANHEDQPVINHETFGVLPLWL